MGVKQVPTAYKTSDGRKFADKALAEAHEVKIEAKSAYEKARRKYARALAESLTTADGYLFKLSVLSDCYYITPGYAGMPGIRSVNFSLWNFDLNDSDETVLVDLREGRRTEYRISELYRRRDNAEKALIKACEERLAELAAELEEMKSNLRERR